MGARPSEVATGPCVVAAAARGGWVAAVTVAGLGGGKRSGHPVVANGVVFSVVARALPFT